MKIKCYRKLGDQGRYVCSIRAIKQAFQNFDICVDIGIVNSYSFDFNARNTPHIRGMIVASFLINHREMGTIRKPILRSILFTKGVFQSLILENSKKTAFQGCWNGMKEYQIKAKINMQAYTRLLLNIIKVTILHMNSSICEHLN